MKKLLITLSLLMGLSAFTVVEARRRKCPKKCPKYCPKKVCCPKEKKCRKVPFKVRTVKFGTAKECYSEPVKRTVCETVVVPVKRRVCHEVIDHVEKERCVRTATPGEKTIHVDVTDEMCPTPEK